MNDLPNLLTDEQRDEYLAAVATFVAANQRMLEAIRPAAQALLAQFWTLHAALRAAGVIDGHGRFIGGTQDDFALCPQPDVAETTADYERLTGHAATCAAGFTDICDCPPARTRPDTHGDDDHA